MRNRDWLLVHVNCHVNGTTFQSGLRFQTGLSSLQVSCKRALIVQLYCYAKRPQYNQGFASELKEDIILITVNLI